MNNKSWIAIFLGLACLVLFVSITGTSNNWLNSGKNINSATPQQINQTIRGIENNSNKDSSNTSSMEENISSVIMPKIMQ